jgi:hypothetical protein
MAEEIRVTNKIFAENERAFIAACVACNIPNTPRQAGKFRRGLGLAYKRLKEPKEGKEGKAKV